MSPKDELAFFDHPGLFPPEVDEVHVSVTWDYDLPKAEKLYKSWSRIAPTKLNGPAIEAGNSFEPGMYLKPGMVITSRGCPNRCWFCRVWRIDGDIKELPITYGYNVLDDNILACSVDHINKVFDMLRKQKEPITFSGGFDIKLITKEICDLLNSIKIWQIFFALDTDDDYEPFYEGLRLIKTFTKYNHRHLNSYVLCGFVGDSFDKAKERMDFVASCGVVPRAMLWHENKNKEWKRFQREYYRSVILATKYKDFWKAA